jgi:2',3'-cyclic-nucleotide 2'-phosphodiesterase/3'-nucleotidase/5'-nucleotidase
VAKNPAFDGFVAGGANSVAVSGGAVAAALAAQTKTAAGAVALFNTDGDFLKLVSVGALPDMLVFTADSKKILVANEGEAHAGIDPEGSISIVDLSGGVRKASARHLLFHRFDSQVDTLRANGVRLFPDVAAPPLPVAGVTVSQDLEPEYIAIDPDGRSAMVTLQEANALARVDLINERLDAILPLGGKDHSRPAAGLDPSDRDGGIRIQTWPLEGLYMPDAITSYAVNGQSYYITANEGDDRGDAAGDPRGDAVRLKDIAEVVSFGRNGLVASSELAGLDDKSKLGRLKISTIDGIDSAGKLEHLHAFGGRSFSILDAGGNRLWDSGDALEQITANSYPEYFNTSTSQNREGDSDRPDSDNRSDKKGPEPEAVIVARVFGRHYAFIGLEHIGGVVIFDVSEPTAPTFVGYSNNRDFSVSNARLQQGGAGDLGPESLLFIAADDSPTGKPLLVVANEVSGSTTIFQIRQSQP